MRKRDPSESFGCKKVSSVKAQLAIEQNESLFAARSCLISCLADAVKRGLRSSARLN